MKFKAFDVFNWEGTICRTRYLVTGLLLLAVKHNIDRIVAAAYGYRWSVFNYWIFQGPSSIGSLSSAEIKFYGELVGISLPFLWVGTVLTIRRLRDAGLPLWLAALFFFPLVNLFLFLMLAIIPSRQPITHSNQPLINKLSRFIPSGEFGSAVFGILSTALISLCVVLLSANGLGNYGWGLFIGIPFLLGLNSVLIYGFHEERSFGKCLLVAVLSVAVVGFLLIGLAIEGFICIAMAFPLANILALLGAVIGYGLQRRRTIDPHAFRVVSLVFLLMPGMTLLEHAFAEEPDARPITTSVVIDAAPEKVWQHVVSFSELPSPTEAIFKTGLAFPIRAEISGFGVGAVRHCNFSTGPFVEPITVWDEPRLLRFNVTSQPAVMEEWSIYNDLRPPHLEHYLISEKGQFELRQLPDGRTLLEGTTWYKNRMWPEAYWRLWSDFIIHRIHNRVLTHIRTLAESGKK